MNARADRPPPRPTRNLQVDVQALAHLGALLARNGRQLGLVGFGEGPDDAEIGRPPSRIHSSPRPRHRRSRGVGRPSFSASAQAASPRAVPRRRSRSGCLRRPRSRSRRAPCRTGRPYLGQRQHCRQRAVGALGDQGMAALPAPLRYRGAPRRQVEGRALGMRRTKASSRAGSAASRRSTARSPSGTEINGMFTPSPRALQRPPRPSGPSRVAGSVRAACPPSRQAGCNA